MEFNGPSELLTAGLKELHGAVRTIGWIANRFFIRKPERVHKRITETAMTTAFMEPRIHAATRTTQDNEVNSPEYERKRK